MKKNINVALIGFGTVGTGVLKIFQNNKTKIENRIGSNLNFKWICDIDLKSKRDVKINQKTLISDWKIIRDDPSIDIVIELIGGYEPAKTIMLEMLKNGKHIVTANKALLSTYWSEIFLTASKFKKLVYFEAAVGAGIPIIQSLNEGLAGNKILKIVGILNGTTNYILSRMQEGKTFQDALKQAQLAGFAESNPKFDIEGVDTTHKLSILVSISENCWIEWKKIYCEGIQNLDVWDSNFADREFDMVIKLLGVSEKVSNSTIEIHTYPTLIQKSHPFANVGDEYNAILIRGDAASDIIFHGKGAGSLPAASAVVSDLIFIAKHIVEGTAENFSYVSYNPQIHLQILPIEKIKKKYYLRFTVKDIQGVLAKITKILSMNNISIERLIQKPQKINSGVPVVIITHPAFEAKVQSAIKVIDTQPFVTQKTKLIRIESI